MVDATAGRWRKYGKDRLYVTGPAGEKLGWHDLVTGEDHIEAPDATEAFHAAVSAWVFEDGASHVVEPKQSTAAEAIGPQPTPPSDPAGPDSPVVCEAPEWEDLASRRAGAMARAGDRSQASRAGPDPSRSRAQGAHGRARVAHWRRR